MLDLVYLLTIEGFVDAVAVAGFAGAAEFVAADAAAVVAQSVAMLFVDEADCGDNDAPERHLQY